MNTTTNISNKGDDRVNETSVYQAWRATSTRCWPKPEPY